MPTAPRRRAHSRPARPAHRRLLAILAGALCKSETYDRSTATWTATPQLVAGRRDHVLVRLRSGYVLAAGGGNFSTSVRTAELFEPPTLATAYASPSPVVRGTPVVISGTGFTAGETIQLANGPTVFATTTADASGSFSVSVATGGFTPKAYIDTARGLTSGRVSYFWASVVAS